MVNVREAKDEQAKRWASYVRELGGPAEAPPFSAQWERYREIFAGRPAGLGPPPAWQPDAATVDASNLAAFMAEQGIASYPELHAWSVARRDEFWQRVVERLGIVFTRPADATLDLSGGVTDPSWFPGARLNIVDSCFRTPADAPAVVSASETAPAPITTTYGELERLVNRVANGLGEHGFRPGDAIALYMPMTVECVAAYLGILRAGCVAVSVADSFAAPELEKRLEISAARAVVTVDRFRRGGRTVELLPRVVEASAPTAIVLAADPRDTLPLRPGDLPWHELLSRRDDAPSVPKAPTDLANILFSSGTTGTPKAIPWTHLTPIKCAMDGHLHHDIRPGDVVAWPTNIGWMMGPWLIFASLINGAAMALFNGNPGSRDFARFVESAGVSVLGVVPSLVRAWRSGAAAEGADWRGVRLLSSTGEPSATEDYLWLMSRTGYRAPVIEYCGGTEIGGGHLTGSVLQPASPATFSTPALGIEVVVLDESAAAVAEGQSGELFLIPPALGLSQSVLNADHHEIYYAGCPSAPDGRPLRRHGDQVLRLAGGFFKAQGRADDTMNLGGIKVSSREIEAVLDEHPAVYECAAVAVQPGGEGAEQLVVFVVPAAEVDVDELRAELQQRLRERLNPLFRIRETRLVDRLPRTASNKLMRRELRAELHLSAATG